MTGFVGARNKPLPLSPAEVDNLLHTEEPEPAKAATGASGAPASGGPAAEQRQKPRAQFDVGETVKVISGPMSDFSGEIAEINEDAQRLKILVSIFGRETPVEVGYDQVKKI